MPTSQKMLPCVRCRKATVHLCPQPNHVLHLLLTLFLLGLWIVPWVIISATQSAPQCTVCGAGLGRRPPKTSSLDPAADRRAKFVRWCFAAAGGVFLLGMLIAELTR